ncbi:MAG: hypothetical protein HC915_10175 [Anaerolineae bacterium]|nr:hypothetical protein [Anaerolineae bacterium]
MDRNPGPIPRPEDDPERAQRLFDWLAAEEPPLDAVEDTAPSRTAPRPAVQEARDERRAGGPWRWAVLGGLGLLMLATLAVTLALFLGDRPQEEEPQESGPEVRPTVAENLPPGEDATPTPENPDPAPTLIPLPTQPVVLFEPRVLPTAAPDEVAVALQAPLTLGGLPGWGSAC